MNGGNRKVKLALALVFSWSLVLALMGSPVLAAEFPSKPITLIVAWAPGGPADLLWRAMAEPMGKILGQPVVVVNKAGGSGALGTVLIKNAAPDGYTIGHVSTSAFLMNPHLFDAGYELKDFTYLYDVYVVAVCLVVRADAPWKNYQEFLQDVKANPMKVRMGYYGPSGIGPVAMKWAAKKEGLKFREILYKGDAPGIPALLGNHIDAFVNGGALIPQVKSGQFRMLLAFTSKPVKGFEDVPLFEKVHGGKAAETTMGLIAPQGVPPAVIAKIEDAVNKSLADPQFQKVAESMSVFMRPMPHREFTEYMGDADRTMKQWLDDLGMTQVRK